MNPNDPIVRLKLEVNGMQHQMGMALHAHAAGINEQMNAAMEEFCKPENLARVVRDQATASIKRAIEEEIRKFYEYGDGRKVVAKAIREKLLAGHIQTPIDELPLGVLPRLYFDHLGDKQYPEGCWACTTADNDETAVYDTFLGHTPSETYMAWVKAQKVD